MVPTITTLLKIATALDRPVGYFLDNDDAPPEPVAFTRAANRPAVFTPHAGLHLAGGAYRGVGIADCVRSGEAAAERALCAS